MNRSLKAIRLMIEGLLNFLDKNSGIYTTYDPMKDAVEEMRDESVLIDQAEMTQEINLKGYAKVKRSRRKTMSLLGDAMRRKIQGAASVKEDGVLYEEMNIPFSKMMYGDGQAAKLNAQHIYDVANGMSAPDKITYQITVPQLADFLNSINGFGAILTAPRSAINNRSAVTESIPSLVRDAMKTVETKLDKFIGNYAGTPFYAQYFSHRIIVDPSYRITTIEAEVKGDDNAALYGVKMKATGKKSGKVYEDMTNTDGNLKKPEISPEVYDIEFELPGSIYEKLFIPDVDIHAGEHQKFTVVLPKKF
jgi:hypothetical protein